MKRNVLIIRISGALFHAAIFLLVMMTVQVFGQKVTKYESCIMACTLEIKARPLIAIRTFLQERERYFLLVDPLTLATSIRKASEVRSCSTSWKELQRQYVPDPYIKGLFNAETTSASLQDAGITHFNLNRAIDLTADLCPSKRELDRDFFKELVKIFGKEESPVPLAIAITGVWMEEHPDDFDWILELVKKGSITVTWINHSYHHRIGKDSVLSRNFLLQKGIDLGQEILRTEKKLIEHGALPSVFFRFPGLVSNDSLFKKVISYGLLPVGSDAWLAKNQWPTDGSIVLVHANGNEPVGIERFFKLLKEEKPKIDNRQWLLFDLSKSVVETEKESYQESHENSPGQRSRDFIEDLDLCE